jgi:uncharacterized membrane protein
METLVLEWLGLLLRWLHVITAIAWIGASFYFVWLDLSLEPPGEDKAQRGLQGELWSIHGGGIYEVGKYRLSPPQMPEKLHWFKWEAYSTWLTGSALMVVLYYAQSQAFLIGTDTWLRNPGTAISGSLLFLGGCLSAYEVTVRTPLVRRPLLFAALVTVAVAAASWLAYHLFAPRAAIIHVGAALATIMAGNVLLKIIPAQKSLVAAIEAGHQPDGDLAAAAKLRSTHNNYFALPVLFCMLANHYPMVYGHPASWILLPAFAVTAALARHYFNVRHQGRNQPAWLIGAGGAFAALALLTTATAAGFNAGAGVAGSLPALTEVDELLSVHCSSCHARMPSFPGYTAPPAGVVLSSTDDLAANRLRAATALRTGYMPLGNLTGMTDEERAQLLGWLERTP